MDQVRYGIIGYGKIGSQHVKKILEGKVPSLKLCAVADTDPERIRAARETLGEWNAPYDVSASAGVFAFPERKYDGRAETAGIRLLGSSVYRMRCVCGLYSAERRQREYEGCRC